MPRKHYPSVNMMNKLINCNQLKKLYIGNFDSVNRIFPHANLIQNRRNETGIMVGKFVIHDDVAELANLNGYQRLDLYNLAGETLIVSRNFFATTEVVDLDSIFRKRCGHHLQAADAQLFPGLLKSWFIMIRQHIVNSIAIGDTNLDRELEQFWDACPRNLRPLFELPSFPLPEPDLDS